MGPIADEEGLPGSEVVVERQGSISHGSFSKEAEAESGTEPGLSEEVGVDKGKEKTLNLVRRAKRRLSNPIHGSVGGPQTRSARGGNTG